MKKLPFLLALVACGTSTTADQPTALYRAPAISNEIDGVRFTNGDWAPDLVAGKPGSSLGNHRAVVMVDSATGDAVRVTIPWRRHDTNPEAKAIVVVDATNDTPVNSFPVKVSNMSGDVVFQPTTSKRYYVYYMPWVTTGGPYPKVTYPTTAHTSNAQWVQRIRARATATLPAAHTTEIQSINAFHSFFPMEVIASPEEGAAILAKQGGWALVSESRDNPIRMRDYFPQHWARDTAPTTFTSQLQRGESFTFQIGVLAGDADRDSLSVRFEGFPDSVAAALQCFNCGGIDENGKAFQKTVSVPKGTVQPIWIGWIVPDGYPAGLVTGNVVVQPKGGDAKTVAVSFEVSTAHAVNHGYDEPELMTRLPWLNSTVGTDPDFIIDPFVPVKVNGHALSILGRRVQLSESGLPDAIESLFTPEMTSVTGPPSPILAAPLDLSVTIGGAREVFTTAPFTIEQQAKGAAHWTAERSSPRLSMQVNGRIEYDGMLEYRIRLTALQAVSLEDVQLPVLLKPDAATFMLGLGQKGGLRPTHLDWKWDITRHQEGAWLGGINKGLQYVLRDDNYRRPLNTNFYQNQPLRLPESWYNNGRGGIRIDSANGQVRAVNYSGPRTLAAGDTLVFTARFLITPFKPLNTAQHFRTRFVHSYVPVDTVRAWGGTVVNIHHANAINPYINYPFYNLEAQKAYIDEAHAKGIKVKLYDTIRELTYRAYELFALRSLGDEILNDGEGGGHSWLQEHLGSGYHAAWHAAAVDDAAILDKGTSRWTNYYIAGLGWLAAHQDIDGLYLDDIAFSRETVKRMVNVLHAERKEVIIDLHSANQFNPRDGFVNSAFLYMEHFPFISRLWFGEYFDYTSEPNYWMTEVSGLPFGLMGEMLQDGGHPYRGLLYGMTARKYGTTDPRPVWHMMDAFGIDQSKMLGYWLPAPPVTTGRKDVLATAYVRENSVLIVLGSWSATNATVNVQLAPEYISGWKSVIATAPEVDGLQTAEPLDLTRVVVPANQGRFILLERER